MPRRERPLESSDDPLVLFAADLRALREKAGGPGYRELGRLAHYSAATLSEAAGGRKLPTLAVTLAFVRACDGDADEWESRWRSLAAGLAPSLPPADVDDAPYLGLAAFQPEHADRFFGRERLVSDLLARLSRHPFLAVFGASGAGKSSLLRAGLLPRADGPSILFTPGAHPLRECAVRVASLTGLSAVQVLAELEADPSHLNLLLRQANVDIVVADQFEEVFTLCADPAERDAFIAALLACRDTRVVIGVRTDFYTHCSRHAVLVDALRDAQVTVGPMSVDELRHAITQPAAQVGLKVESALLAHLVASTNDRVGVLPLLSHALLETWHRRRGTTLTLTGFEAAGGIDGALARTADEIYSSFPEAEQDSVRRLFLRLTAPGEGTEDTKRRIDRAELDDEVPAALVSARLLTVDGDRVEITHESLIRSWPRLRDWLAEDRAALRAHRQLTDATTEWETHDRDPGALYRGARLAVARELHRDALSRREVAFLDASLAAEDEQLRVARRQTRRTRVLAAALGVLLLVASSIAVYATRAQAVSESRALAAQALQMHDTDVPGALRNSLAAYTASPTTEARSALIYNAGRPANHGVFPSSGFGVTALSPDGTKLAISGEGDEIGLWDVASRRQVGGVEQPREPSGRWSTTTALAYSSDNSLLAIGNSAGLHVHDFGSGVTRTLNPPRQGEIMEAVFGPGDRRVYAVVSTGTYPAQTSYVAQWDVATRDTGGNAREIGVGDDVAIDPRGTAFLYSRAGVLTAFDPDTGATRTASPNQGGGHLAVSPDGITVATTDGRGTVALVDGRTLTSSGELVIGALVTGMAFADAGRLLVVCTEDEVQLWEVASHAKVHQQKVGTYSGPNTPLTGTDGTIIVTGSRNITLRRLADLPRLHGNRSFAAVGLTPEGAVASGPNRDQQPQLLTWPSGSALPLVRPTGAKDLAPLSLFTPDGTGMVITQNDAVEIKDVRTGDTRTTLVPEEKHRASLGNLWPRVGPFSGDGRLLATQMSGYGLVWDVARSRTTKIYSASSMLAFSPDSQRFALYDPEGVIRVQDMSAEWPGPEWQSGVRDGQFFAYGVDDQLMVARPDGELFFLNPFERTETGRVHAHNGGMSDMVLSPDGKLLATVGADRELNIWDTTTRQLWASLPITNGAQAKLAWKRDGTELAVADDDGVTAWPISPDLATRKACQRLKQDFANFGSPPAGCR
ncbi:hypothetical protein FKR81_13600 [Lentzea tibetensis]|uniref:Novel STAND NTPase 1 domain-containing protein n=1 Tax=Lentzea tibetensis TaxID=2591470 RepID=A0A563EW27_9PSEU|nr:hypothetical protein [Lentzea tibetensis]TWP51879.1 hypothetical protein FKR81_13600 [Lentzea tibetensis]